MNARNLTFVEHVLTLTEPVSLFMSLVILKIGSYLDSDQRNYKPIKLSAMGALEGLCQVIDQINVKIVL